MYVIQQAASGDAAHSGCDWRTVEGGADAINEGQNFFSLKSCLFAGQLIINAAQIERVSLTYHGLDIQYVITILDTRESALCSSCTLSGTIIDCMSLS